MTAAPVPEEILRTTSGKENFQRITRLLISGGTSLLREMFDSICPSSNLPTILSNPVTKKRLKAAKLTMPQWHCLCPSPGVYGKSADFDVTLLVRLLRTICNLTPPSTGWDVLPLSTDHSLTADITRIKYYRNSVYGHVNQGMEIRDSEFKTLWQEISEALVRIAGQISSTRKTAWQGAIAKYLTDPLTTEDERNVQELKAWYKSDMKIKKSIYKVSERISHLETALHEGTDLMEATVCQEAKEIKDHLEEMNQSIDTLASSSAAKQSSRAPLRLKIDSGTISGPGLQQGGTVMIGQPQESQGVVKEGAVTPVTSSQSQVSNTTASLSENVTNGALPFPQQILNLIASKYLKNLNPSTTEDFNGFVRYMKEIRKVITVPALEYKDMQIRNLPYGIRKKLSDQLDIDGPCDWKALISVMPTGMYSKEQVTLFENQRARKDGSPSMALLTDLGQRAKSVRQLVLWLENNGNYQALDILKCKAPPEIIARGSQATEAYNRALLEGRGYARRVPVMIIGQERTGKTSLKRSLKGELFNPNEGSTKGIETDPSYFKVSTDVWRTGKKSEDTEPEPTFSFEHQVAQLIVESLKKGVPNSPEAESTDIMENIMTGLTKLVEEATADSEEPRTKRMDSTLENSQDHLRVPMLPEDIATLVQRLLEMPDNDEDDIHSIIWDFGGQSVYYDTHPIFLTKKAIYILTCDLSHDPNQKANAPTKKGMSGKKEDTYCSKTNLDCLNFWMSSVYSLVCPNTIRQETLAPEMLPPVFLVCTHADEPYRTDKIPGDLASEIYGSLKEKVYGKLLKGLFVVDNTKSGSGDECRGVIKLREKVLSFAKELPQMKEAIPLKWLKYEKELHLWSERREWIPIEEAGQIAKKECGIDDDVQFRTLLNFLHDQRVFIHFSESPELENMVILRPQWLIDVFKEVITVKSWQDVDENFEQQWCNLEKNGILDEKLLDHAWRHLLDKQEPTYKSSLIAIMERFNLLCPWPSDGTTKQYLVPSMLMSPPTEDVLKHLDCVRIPSLFVVFNSGRVPPGLFSRLLVLFHRYCQEEWKSEINPELFSNFAMFHIIPIHAISIVIILYSSSIAIVFHDGSDSCDLNTSRAIYSQLKCLLEDIRKESFWLKDMKYEMCICCPVCSQKDSRCRAHDVRGCECLHLLSELKLRDRPYCNKPGIRGDPTININTFEHWFALSEAQGSSTPLSQHQDVTQRDNNGEHRITPKEETASERSASDPPEVIINQLKNWDLPKRATHLDVSRLPVDVLLLTVEDCEFLSCLSYLNPGFCRNFHRDLAYVYLGDMGKDERKLNVAVMNCYRGSASAGGSTVVVLNAVKVLRPKAVFCVGSCRSLDCNKVKLGDVVILEKLITYGPCKITEGGIEERGVKVQLKSGLSKVMLRAGDGWQPPLKDLNAREVEIHRGAFLSGAEEVIDRKRCEALIERFPEVVAIEREGEGLYAAAHDLDIEWTVIKGISGYVDGRNESNSWRTFASLMAASLMAHILSDAIPFQDMPHYRNETEERGKKHTSCKTCKKVGNSGRRRKKQRKGKETETSRADNKSSRLCQ